jgi:hypothetical protein
MGPCSWNVASACCPDWDTFSPALQAQAEAYASLVLWAATGRQYGLCPQVVRPCGRQCDTNWNGMYWSDGVWIPYIFNGTWYNCMCGLNLCQCAPQCQIYLPGPVDSVSQVLMDGAIVDPATWRVDDAQWLVRTGTGNCWPLRQDYGLDVPAVNTLQVTYLRGLPVPDALLTAAGTLACEYAKACSGAACRLPSRVASVARQGVSVTMVDVDTLLKHNLTGIQEVDQVIVSLNPHGLHGKTRFYSPDSPVTRTVTTA